MANRSELNTLLVTTLVLVSGFCSLVYQVAWLRLLQLFLGVSTYASATVVAVFMGGLGIGGLWVGKRIGRSRNPLRIYAMLEVAIALSAGVSPFVIALARSLYVAVASGAELGATTSTVVRIGLSMSVLMIPTVAMGGTLPAVTQALARRSDRGRAGVAWLYGANTAGAFLGALMTTFWLVELLGVENSIWLAAAINMLLATCAWSYSRSSPRVREEAVSETHSQGPRCDPSRSDRKRILVLAFLFGFVFFVMEITWYRLLAPLLGGSSYTFGLILSFVLLGIGTGGLVFGCRRTPGTATLRLVATTALVEAAALLFPFLLGDKIAVLAQIARSLAAFGFDGLVLGWSLVTVLVVLPASFVAGYQFPALVSAMGSRSRQVGRDVGLVYVANTLGAVLGSLLGATVLMTSLGAISLWRWSIVALVVTGAASGAGSGGRRRSDLAWLVGALTILSLSWTATGPTSFWRHQAVGAGRAQMDLRSANKLEKMIRAANERAIAEIEGMESSIALVAFDDLSLLVNGKSDGGGRNDAPTVVMSPLIGALLHPEPRVALVVGLGSGTSAGWLAAVDTIERVDVVELEPAVVEFATEFGSVNRNVLDNPKVNVILGDGREVILTAAEQYDLIFSEPSNPYRAGVAGLFSRDFYLTVMDRLAAGGMFLQWLQGYEVDARVVEIAYATLGSVFPVVETWQVDASDLLLVGSMQPIKHDFGRLRRLCAEEPFQSAMALTWGVGGVEGLYSGFVGGSDLGTLMASDAKGRLSTDDRPLIEFGFARSVGMDGGFEIVQLVELASEIGATRSVDPDGELDWDLVVELRRSRAVMGTVSVVAEALADESARTRHFAREAYKSGRISEALSLWLEQASTPVSAIDVRLVVEGVVVQGESPDSRLFANLTPTEGHLIAAQSAWKRGDSLSAAADLERAFERARNDAWFGLGMMARGFQLARAIGNDPSLGATLFRALRTPFAVHLFDDKRRRLRLQLASTVDFGGLCVEAFDEFEPNVPWEAALLELRATCYLSNDHPLASRALAELSRFRHTEPLRLGLPNADLLEIESLLDETRPDLPADEGGPQAIRGE